MSEGAPSRNVAGADFLQRVVDRAFGQASALTPRLPSLYEPPGPSVVWPAEFERSGERQPAVDGASVQSAAQAASRDSSIEVPAPRRNDAAVSIPGAEVERRVPTSDDRIETRAADDAAVRDRPRSRSSARSTDHAPGAEPGLALRASDARVAASPAPDRRSPSLIPDRSEASLPARDAPVIAQAIREGVVAHAASETGRAAQLNDRSAPRPHDERHASESPQRRVVLEAPTVRRRLERAATLVEPAPPAPEPVVNVTIGRIEIRAVAPQPGPLRQVSRAPKPLSLDDYLKRREGGR